VPVGVERSLRATTVCFGRSVVSIFLPLTRTAAAEVFNVNGLLTSDTLAWGETMLS
jgi:hypothetical protein